MNRIISFWLRAAVVILLGAGLVALAWTREDDAIATVPSDRREVVFWHFWGGKDRPVVEEIVRRFNASQDRHFVRAIAIPGSNLDVKFFLSVAGGDPPDVLNHDDPVIADWALRGAIRPIEELAGPQEYAELQQWFFPTAREICTYDNRLYGVCNGLDIRALYYDRAILDEYGLTPPATLTELDRIAVTIAPPDETGPRRRFGYLPDPRRLWAWGIAFGGRFCDPQTGELTALAASDVRQRDWEPIVRALEWMASYSELYGAEQVAAFRKGDQALTGASFPLLEGRYAVVMDGQWRVAETAAANRAAIEAGHEPIDYGVAPLPPPLGGRQNAGWMNGNFFVVPTGCRNPEGAWEFIKFWSGFGGHEREAARACAAGGWIPASPCVVAQAEFQQYLAEYPEFRQFVELAGSENQIPTPVVAGAAYLWSQIVLAAEEAMYLDRPPRDALDAAVRRIHARQEEIALEAR